MVQQSRKMSFLEQCASTAVGFVLSLIALPLLCHFTHVEITHAQNFTVTMGMTVLSVTRGYFTRRFFNWLHMRQHVAKGGLKF